MALNLWLMGSFLFPSSISVVVSVTSDSLRLNNAYMSVTCTFISGFIFVASALFPSLRPHEGIVVAASTTQKELLTIFECFDHKAHRLQPGLFKVKNDDPSSSASQISSALKWGLPA